MKKSKIMERVILHSDLNNFFASVEAVLNPEYRGEGKCVAVCGKVEQRHGIVLAKNENAKKMGVKTGEAIWQAKDKCPNLIIAEPHYDKYEYFSRIVRAIYEEYTDEVEAFGIDECWLDVTRSQSLFGSGADIAETIRRRVKSETGLTVSVGVSFNKVFAKLCSDMKKPDAVCAVGRENFRERLWPLAAGDMLGVGPATAAVLERHGVMTIGELARMPEKYVEKWLGKCGVMIHNYANGLDDSPVANIAYSEMPKSVGRGMTPPCDITDIDSASRLIMYLAQDVSSRLRARSLVASGVTLSVKNTGFVTCDYSKRFEFPTRSARELHSTALDILKSRMSGPFQPIRALTVRATALSPDTTPTPLSFFHDTEKTARQEKKEQTVDAINAKFGARTVFSGALVGYL